MEQEEAEDQVEAAYKGGEVETGSNVKLNAAAKDGSCPRCERLLGLG
jgi:hypothetical protein